MPDHSPQRQEATEPAGPLESQTDNLPEKRTGKHPGGRPSLYTSEISKAIISIIDSDVVNYAKAIDDDPGLPRFETVNTWIDGEVKAALDDKFPERYARAVRSRARRRLIQTDEIVDTCIPDKSHVALADLRLRQRIFMSTKLDPMFGDKAAVSVTNVTNQVLGMSTDDAIGYLVRRGKIYLPEDRKALIEAPVEAIEVEAIEASKGETGEKSAD